MILGVVHRSPGICLQLRKPQNTSARRPSDEGAVRPVIASNGVNFLQMRSVGSHSTSGREKEGNKERTIVYRPAYAVAVDAYMWAKGLHCVMQNFN